MEFQVGAFRYEVVITDELIEVDGEPKPACTDHFAGIVHIWKGSRGAQRMRCLSHELRHCWTRRFGPAPTNDEEDADRTGHFGQWFADTLERQGGSRALDDLLSPQEAEAAARDARLSFVSVEDEAAEDQPAKACAQLAQSQHQPLMPPVVRPSAPCCGGYLPDRAVRNGPAKLDEGLHIQERVAYCPTCEIVSLWSQPCTAGGRPLGDVPFGLVVLSPAESEDYLQRNPGLRADVAVA